jgi:hypothetical protein
MRSQAKTRARQRCVIGDDLDPKGHVCDQTVRVLLMEHLVWIAVLAVGVQHSSTRLF